jgi:hypothetical protein
VVRRRKSIISSSGVEKIKYFLNEIGRFLEFS